MEDKNKLPKSICAIVGHDWTYKVVKCNRCGFHLLQVSVNGVRQDLWIDWVIIDDYIKFYDHMDDTDRIQLEYINRPNGTLFTYAQYADNKPIYISHLP